MISPSTQRAAARIQSILERQLEDARRELEPLKVTDPEVLAAAKTVVEAADRIEAERYTRNEIAARQALLRRAKELGGILKRKGLS